MLTKFLCTGVKVNISVSRALVKVQVMCRIEKPCLNPKAMEDFFYKTVVPIPTLTVIHFMTSISIIGRKMLMLFILFSYVVLK